MHCFADCAEDEEVAFGSGNGHDQVGWLNIVPISDFGQAVPARDYLTVAHGNPLVPVWLQVALWSRLGLATTEVVSV
jgi:hypothetical protein